MSWDANDNVFTENDASGNFGNGFGANGPGTVGNTYTGNSSRLFYNLTCLPKHKS